MSFLHITIDEQYTGGSTEFYMEQVQDFLRVRYEQIEAEKVLRKALECLDRARKIVDTGSGLSTPQPSDPELQRMCREVEAQAKAKVHSAKDSKLGPVD